MNVWRRNIGRLSPGITNNTIIENGLPSSFRFCVSTLLQAFVKSGIFKTTKWWFSTPERSCSAVYTLIRWSGFWCVPVSSMFSRLWSPEVNTVSLCAGQGECVTACYCLQDIEYVTDKILVIQKIFSLSKKLQNFFSISPSCSVPALHLCRSIWMNELNEFEWIEWIWMNLNEFEWSVNSAQNVASFCHLSLLALLHLGLNSYTPPPVTTPLGIENTAGKIPKS